MLHIFCISFAFLVSNIFVHGAQGNWIKGIIAGTIASVLFFFVHYIHFLYKKRAKQ